MRLGVLLRRSSDQNRHRQALQRAIQYDQQIVKAGQQRLGRADQLLVERVGARRRERCEMGVSLRLEARAQRRHLIGQRLRAYLDPVKGNTVAAQHPYPVRVVGGQIKKQALIAREQRPRRLGRQRLRVAKFAIARKLRRDPCIEIVEAAAYIRERTAQRSFLGQFAVGRRATDCLHESAVEQLPLLHQILALTDHLRAVPAACR
jgi:hypothetical protein